MSHSFKQTPLYTAHLEAGARMVPFAGYSMPVQYGSIVAEAKAVREKVGMFDVSHMGRFRVVGKRAIPFLEWVTTNRVEKLGDNKGQYTLMTNPEGGCIDDLILYRLSAEEFYMVVNATNRLSDLAWIQSQNREEAEIQDVTEKTAMIAVQGPLAAETLTQLCEEGHALQSVPFFGVFQAKIQGVDCLAARCGYTGEDGFELVCHAEKAEQLWKTLLEAEVVPCGLGARDILRVEAGFPLYGHELDPERSPVAAGLDWVIDKDKAFVGSGKVQKTLREGAHEKLVGIQVLSKRLPSPDMKVFVRGKIVGKLTSGVYSPLLECGIGLAYVWSSVELDADCEVEMRGRLEKARIVNKRFLKRPK